MNMAKVRISCVAKKHPEYDTRLRTFHGVKFDIHLFDST